MARIVALFNHKGGVSKTTTSFNLGWSLSKKGFKVLLVDADPQSNLTSLSLSLPDEAAFENLYRSKDSNDIYSLVLQMRTEGRKDLSRNDSIANIVPTGQENLFILPGHLQIEEFSTQISLALELGRSPQFAPMANIPGYLDYALRKLAEIHHLDYIIIDMAPSLSGLNEVLLMSSDFFIAPCSPDFFSEIALKNLSKIIPLWYEQVKNFNTVAVSSDLKIRCQPKFLGIIQHNYRPRRSKESDDKNKPTQSFQIWVDRVRAATNTTLVPALSRVGLAVDRDFFARAVTDQQPYDISLVSDFNSLIAVSQMKNKPVFELLEEDLKSSANVYGNAVKTMLENVRKFKETFEDIADKVIKLTQ